MTLNNPATEMVAEEKLLTGEELLEMGDIGRTELIEGRIRYLMPTERPHSRIESLIITYLNMYNFQHNLGEVHGGEFGVYTRRNPDTVRGMDAAFISFQRLENAKTQGFLDVAPELIVEVMSPSDRWSEIQTKLAEYFNIGVEVVWLVDPQLEQVHVYRSMTDVTLYKRSDVLTEPNILPEFELAIDAIFG